MNKGIKHDQGKLRYDLVPPEFIEALAEVMTHGAKEYKENTWQDVDSERYYAALMRHIQDWRKGNNMDKKSGLHHLKLAMCNTAFLVFKEGQSSE